MAEAAEPRRYRAKRITDPRELRALAHPLRQRLITELFARGQGSVGQLADAVGEPVNKVSFHLRQLAKYGFLEEAPELARDGRDRWWRILYPDGIDIDPDLFSSAEGQLALHERQGGQAASLNEIYEFFTTHDIHPGYAFCHDWFLRATPEEFAEFDREYLELCRRWRDRIHRELAEDGDDARRTYAIYIFGWPQDSSDEEPA